PQLVGLVDDSHRGAHGDAGEEFGDIGIVHAKAAVTDPHADAEGFVGAMDYIATHGQVHLVRPHGVIRPRRHYRRQRITRSGVFLTERLGWIPGGVGLLAGDPGLADG